MAAKETNLDFNWRDPANAAISNRPRPLENDPNSGGQKVKCYRNVIFTWLFHTPALLNWIDDNHEPQLHGENCFLCRLRRLATRFWARNRHNDTTFNIDVDRFWRDTYNPAVILNLDQQNDVEEYVRSLLGFLDLDMNSDPRWTRPLWVQKECVKICERCSFLTQHSESGYVLQGKISGEDTEYQPLCRTLQFNKPDDFRCNRCDGSRRHEVSYGLLDAPPILVIHCQPHIYHAELVENVFTSFVRGKVIRSVENVYTSFLRGKVTKLEHSMAFSSYLNNSLDPNTIYWAFYHLYGVILRSGDTDSSGHYVCAFEQRQTGRWLFFDDEENAAEELTRSRLDDKVDQLQKGGQWRIFMLMYQRLFRVPVRLLAVGTSSSTAIALQNQQSQEEFLVSNGESVEDYELADPGSDSGQARGETQGAADDELQGDPSDSQTRDVQAEQSMPTELPTQQDVEVEADPEVSASKPDIGDARRETQGAADDAIQGDAGNKISDVQTDQPLPTEQNVAVEADPQSSTPKPELGQTRSRKQAAKTAQKETQDKYENEQIASSQPASETVKTEVKTSTQPKKKGTGSKATKRTRGKALDDDEQTARSVPASKRTKTKADSLTQPGGTQSKSKATKRAARKDDSDEHEDEKAEISAPSTKSAKTEVEPSTGHDGRETRSRAAAKRARGEAPDADKIQEEYLAASRPAPKKAKTAKTSAQPGKAQKKSKAQRKK